MKLQDSIMWKEIFEQAEVVKHSLEVNLAKLETIAQLTKKRGIKTVLLVGRGSSDHAAQLARYIFEKDAGMNVIISAPSSITMYHANLDYREVLCIGISQSGAAQDVYAVMQVVQKQGGIVVSITNEPNCLMEQGDHIKINNECGPEKSTTAAKSYMTQLVLLLALAYCIKGEDKQFVEKIPEVIQEAYKLKDQVEKIIPVFRNCHDLLFFGRGILYGLATESELKIQETCYLNARAYASSDYRHGPIAATERFIPAIFFLMDPESDESTLTLHNDLKNDKDVYTIIVSQNPDYCALANQAVLLDKKASGIYGAIAGAIFSQMFACMLSIARGYNPDQPVGLSKHTVTL
ncbi:MAG: SIS domain-containing protein [Erysipelotrichaceae bacterium]|jgi:glucosamine--fructose-6-phosphate aminotransferase (isomerizing)|nr:SIS domain-containing protein [Erysipelotrichaceae bacterium]